ncbi:hypothetical protein [Paraburkholderia pallida]|uniref:Uncharacterized protein n=1 Tax=Paraburkholderia pallida TaxID=2547399 RepID=A0A4P7CQ24_9BURK|nr:hypothetical protein [Paraburkholderia pallida]QBQ96291.1 hypothetical protein E1956_03295 [Paraburkholderia pallida]
MNIKIFNVCLLLGWLMVLAGGIVIHPGWGIAVAGAILIVLTLLAAYLAGWEHSANPKSDDDGVNS